MTLMEALLSSRKYYKTDRNYIFTIDKPSTTKAAIAGGTLGAVKGGLTGLGTAYVGSKGGTKLAAKAAGATGTKKKILELSAKAATGIGKFAAKSTGKAVMASIGASAAIPLGAIIGHAMAKRKLKHADPYVKGILDKVKGEEIKRKQYRSLLKGQQTIGVSAHRLFPRGTS